MLPAVSRGDVQKPSVPDPRVEVDRLRGPDCFVSPMALSLLSTQLRLGQQQKLRQTQQRLVSSAITTRPNSAGCHYCHEESRPPLPLGGRILHPGHMAEQIASMDHVYRGADLTLVAAAGEDKRYGLPGVSSTDRKQGKIVRLEHATLYTTFPDPNVAEIERSIWLQRVWKFQEGVLAGKLLVFTEHQMVFYCQSASWAEGIAPRDAEFYLKWSISD
jgi:hypothetical protein